MVSLKVRALLQELGVGRGSEGRGRGWGGSSVGRCDKAGKLEVGIISPFICYRLIIYGKMKYTLLHSKKLLDQVDE